MPHLIDDNSGISSPSLFKISRLTDTTQIIRILFKRLNGIAQIITLQQMISQAFQIQIASLEVLDKILSENKYANAV